MRLAGKRAFVTAAGQGIGRASAETLAREGAHVIATDLRAELLDGLEVAETFALDVTDKAALVAAVQAAQPDVLVNCSGVVHAGTILEATDDEFDPPVRMDSSDDEDAPPVPPATRMDSSDGEHVCRGDAAAR